MITEFLLDVVFGIVKFLIGLIPIVDVATETLSGITALLDMFNKISFIIPMNTISVCVGIWVLMMSAKFTVGLVNWLIRKLPGIS